jgi:RNase P subunit RPR2
MKVIKRGSWEIAAVKLHRLTCDRCDSLLEVLSTELHDSGDQRDLASMFMCCVCRKINYVAAALLARSSK